MRALLRAALHLIVIHSSATFAADLPRPRDCIPTSRVKTFPPKEIIVLRGDGIPGSRIHSIEFTMMEQRYSDCRIASSWALKFKNYNWFQSGRPPGARASWSIRLLAQGRVIEAEGTGRRLNVPLGFCGPFGTDGRPHSWNGRVNFNLIDATDDILIEASRISGRLGQC